jgi:hypothetical protein
MSNEPIIMALFNAPQLAPLSRDGESREMAGVGAGTGALSSLLGKLTTLLSDEYTLLKSIRKEIAFLERELRSMHALLETLADMHNLDPVEKVWKGNLRELSYDIEDCIDHFMLRLGNRDVKRGIMKRTLHRLKTLWKRHDVATEIQELKARVMEESKRRDRYKFDNCNPRRPVVELDPRLATFHDEAKSLVAIDGQMNQVIAWLTEESMELKVVPIVGCAGLGKTTLAMAIYRKIGGSFQHRASVSVSTVLHLEKLLKDVLSQISQDEFRKCQSEGWALEQIIREISKVLTEKRYVILISIFPSIPCINSYSTARFFSAGRPMTRKASPSFFFLSAHSGPAPTLSATTSPSPMVGWSSTTVPTIIQILMFTHFSGVSRFVECWVLQRCLHIGFAYMYSWNECACML